MRPIFYWLISAFNLRKSIYSALSNYKETKKYSKVPRNKIICGDAIEAMQAMPSDCVDLVVTSPPYDELRDYKGYSFNFEASFPHFYMQPFPVQQDPNDR